MDRKGLEPGRIELGHKLVLLLQEFLQQSAIVQILFAVLSSIATKLMLMDLCYIFISVEEMFVLHICQSKFILPFE